MTIRAIGLGAGGNARSVLDALAEAGEIQVVGLLDALRVGSSLDGIAVLGGDELLPELRTRGVTHFFVGIGGAGRAPWSGNARAAVHAAGLAAGLEPLTVIHPGAIVSRRATLGAGACVLAGAVINAGANVGVNALINTGAIVEHDCHVGAHAHVATGARLAGAVWVGDMAHVGAGATIRQGLTIGDGAVVGIGAAVTRDVVAATVVAGVPARRLTGE